MLHYFNPLTWGRWIGQWFHGWALSIRWSDAPKAIPALILLVVLSITSIIAWSDASDWRMRRLTSQLQRAWDLDEYDTAELIIRRQLSSDSNNTDAVYSLALTLNAKNEYEDAASLMRQLVELRSHEQSARWLLNKEYLQADWSKLDQEEREEFGSLLELVHRSKPSDTKAANLYADFLIAVKDYAKALPVLDLLSQNQPMRGLQAAAICRSLGNDANADLYAERCLDKVSKMLLEDPSNGSLALSVAQNQLFLDRYSEGVETLATAINNTKSQTEAAQLRLAIGDAIVAWVEYIEASPVESRTGRVRILKMLQEALEFAPNNPRVMALVADHVLATVDDDDEEIATIRTALIEGSSQGIAHFIRGTAALVKDDLETATKELKIAQNHMPHSGAILNNLAVSLIKRDDEHLEQAFKLVDSAIKTPAKEGRAVPPHFYETRGQILVRMKRYLDAIPDLEKAVPHQSLAAQAHASLATCYAEIGEPELSREHREAAKRKSGSKKAAKPKDDDLSRAG